MEKKIEAVHHDHRQTLYRRKWRSPCMQPSRKNTSHNNNCWVWVPTIPSWEKEFCYKIGLFKWENFLEAKKLTVFANKILEWNDSEAEEAFYRAKNRFFAKINNLPGPDNESIPGPDLYIDEIDWDHDEEINPDGLEFTKSESSSDDEEDEANVINTDYVPDSYHVRFEDINPTGWDIDVHEFSMGKVLTGLIVGR